LRLVYDAAVRETIEQFENTGSPIITDRLLRSFIDLNNLVLERFSPEERRRIGVHTCPGADRDSSHSAVVAYAELLPSLFDLQVGRFYMQLASEPDRPRVLKMVRDHI